MEPVVRSLRGAEVVNSCRSVFSIVISQEELAFRLLRLSFV